MNRIRLLLSFILVAVPLVLLSGCGETNQYAPPPPPTVTVATPLQQTVTDYLEETGTTEAVETVEIRARVKGFLEKIEFQEGQEVKAGDLLYLIDPKPFEATVRQANAGILLTKARLESAKAEVERSKAEAANAEAQYQRGFNASKLGGVTPAEVDDLRTARDTAVAAIDVAEAQVASAEAEIRAAEAQLVQAKLDLGYTKVVAPISGRVGKTLVDVGNLVGSNESTHLATVIKYDPIYAKFNINERDLLEFTDERANEDIDDRGKGFKIDLRRANDEDYKFKGEFQYADLAVDESTGTYMVRAIFPNPKRLIVPGLFVRIRIPKGVIPDALLVPESALAADQAGRYLYTVGEDDVVERKNITLGPKMGDFVVVTKGLQPNNRVIVSGVQRARSGAKVNPEETSLGTSQAEETATASAPAAKTPADSPKTN